jgi:hypothetical protein
MTEKIDLGYSLFFLLFVLAAYSCLITTAMLALIEKFKGRGRKNNVTPVRNPVTDQGLLHDHTEDGLDLKRDRPQDG